MGVSVLYIIYIDGTALTITLRPHQQRITDRMLAYNKGQIIVPTGGGKTLTMIMDTQIFHDVINNWCDHCCCCSSYFAGRTTVF